MLCTGGSCKDPCNWVYFLVHYPQTFLWRRTYHQKLPCHSAWCLPQWPTGGWTHCRPVPGLSICCPTSTTNQWNCQYWDMRQLCWFVAIVWNYWFRPAVLPWWWPPRRPHAPGGVILSVGWVVSSWCNKHSLFPTGFVSSFTRIKKV